MHDIYWMPLGIGIGIIIGYYARRIYEWASQSVEG